MTNTMRRQFAMKQMAYQRGYHRSMDYQRALGIVARNRVMGRVVWEGKRRYRKGIYVHSG